MNIFKKITLTVMGIVILSTAISAQAVQPSTSLAGKAQAYTQMAAFGGFLVGTACGMGMGLLTLGYVLEERYYNAKLRRTVSSGSVEYEMQAKRAARLNKKDAWNSTKNFFAIVGLCSIPLLAPQISFTK